MRNPTLVLRLSFACIFLTAALVIGLFESGLLTYTTIDGYEPRYVVGIVGVGLTLALLPLALKLLTFALPRHQASASVGGYVRWSLVRQALLALPMCFNLVCYYLLGRHATSGWMAMMAAVMFCFVWPTDGRMRYERASDYPTSER